MTLTTTYDNTVIGHTAIYNKEHFKIEAVDKKEQLFKIRINGQEKWIRPENCEYIPF